jgi:hypothetical protein
MISLQPSKVASAGKRGEYCTERKYCHGKLTPKVRAIRATPSSFIVKNTLAAAVLWKG